MRLYNPKRANAPINTSCAFTKVSIGVDEVSRDLSDVQVAELRRRYPWLSVATEEQVAEKEGKVLPEKGGKPDDKGKPDKGDDAPTPPPTQPQAYHCSDCDREHKPGTKIFDEHKEK